MNFKQTFIPAGERTSRALIGLYSMPEMRWTPSVIDNLRHLFTPAAISWYLSLSGQLIFTISSTYTNILNNKCHINQNSSRPLFPYKLMHDFMPLFKKEKDPIFTRYGVKSLNSSIKLKPNDSRQYADSIFEFKQNTLLQHPKDLISMIVLCI